MPNTFLYTLFMGGSRNFGKEGPVRGRSPEPSTEGRRGVWGPLPENFEKLDAISCNLAYMASDIIQNWAFAE